MKIVLIIMATLVAVALVVLGTANASVGVVQRSSANVQSIIGSLKKAESILEYSRRLEMVSSSVKRLRHEYNQRLAIVMNSGNTDTVLRTHAEYQQEAVRIKSMLVKELENSEFYLDDVGLLSMLDDIDALLQRVHVID